VEGWNGFLYAEGKIEHSSLYLGAKMIEQ